MLTHAEGEGQAAFSRWKHSTEVPSERDDGVTCKQSLFVEPVSWMQSDVQQLQGKVENQNTPFPRDMETINEHKTCFF